jgi:membrane protease YdiL (CAAX protease family)
LRPFAKALAPAFLLTLAAAYAGHLRGLAVRELVEGLPAIFLLLAAVFLLSIPEIVGPLSQWCRASPGRALLALQGIVLPYLLYSLLLGCFSLQGFVKLLLYIHLPFLALGTTFDRPAMGWREGLAVLMLWIPLEFRLVGPLWPWPPGQGGYFLFSLLGVCLAAYLFIVVRGMKEVGYTFSVSRRDLALAVLGFVLFAPFAVGIGLGTGFLRISSHPPALLPAVARTLGIFLAIGVPEELLFRGLLQNLLLRWTASPSMSLVLASLVFGIAHLNNGPRPDPRFFLLATLAGAVYGQIYRRSGTLMAPALTHTLVDATWSIFFRG